MILINHWRVVRALILILVAGLVISTILSGKHSAMNWIGTTVLVFIGGTIFAFCYSWPFLMRSVSEANHKLFKTMNPRSTWIQKILFWFSLLFLAIGMCTVLAKAPELNASWLSKFMFELSPILGLFIGSGNFLHAELEKSDGIED